MKTSDVATARAVSDKMSAADLQIFELLGIRIDNVEPGRARVKLKVREDMVNSHRYAHGGIAYTLADTAFAYACSSENDSIVTLSAHVVYTKAAKQDDELTAEAVVTTRGSRTGTCDVEVTNQHGDVIARYQGVYFRRGQPIVDD